MLALFCVTVFLSATLLFLIELLIAKMILPLAGGTPSVWNTCLVFFQAILLVGYGYSHALSAWLPTRRQLLVHGLVLLVPLLAFPLSVARWAPSPGAGPMAWLLLLLLAVVGLPAFIVSTSAPLLQKWFTTTSHPAARDPYFLYGASNLGSMVALIAYPILIEPRLGLAAQALLWEIAYGLLVVLIVACAVLVRRFPAPDGKAAVLPVEDRPVVPWSPGGLLRRLRWLALAFVPSSLMLGVTLYLTTDLASTPMLWVVPLALYLLTYILAFANLPLLLHRVVLVLLVLVLVLLVVIPVLGVKLWITEAMQLHLVAVFAASLVCHGELARARPPAAQLTEFYLWLALGGALGGAFNALAAPLLFDHIVEYPLMLAAACLLLPRFHLDPASRRARRLDLGLSVAIGLFGVVVAMAFADLDTLAQQAPGSRILYRGRSFFGVLRVDTSPGGQYHNEHHGMTLHGVQCREASRRREPLSYYTRRGPIGQVFEAFQGERTRKRVAVVGLGVGTLAAYADKGQQWTFYEIDPAVVQVARDTRLFTYLHDSEERQAEVRVVLGDARLQLQQSGDRYDLIVLDAFSSDTIPTHLLTREAVQVYLDHLEEDGVLAFHISSLRLVLYPVLAGLGHNAGLTSLIQQRLDIPKDEVKEGKLPSEWVVMARRPEVLGKLGDDERWLPLVAEPTTPLWTDDYSNPFQQINWEGKPQMAPRRSPSAATQAR